MRRVFLLTGLAVLIASGCASVGSGAGGGPGSAAGSGVASPMPATRSHSPAPAPATTSTLNGEQDKPPQQVLDDTVAALKSAASVHVAGGGESGGRAVRLDLTMSRGGRSQGTVTVSGALFNIVIFADAQYLKADASAWRVAGVPPATAQLIADRWLKTSRTSKLGQDFDFTLSALAAELTADVKLAPNVGRSTLDGRPVVVLTDNGRNPGRLYVANTGKPYPVMMEATGAGNAGNLKFTQYGASVTIEAPPTAIPLPEQTA